MGVVRTIGQAFEISHKLSSQTKEQSTPVLKQKELSKESTNKSQDTETKAASVTNLNSSANSSKSLVKSKQLASSNSVNKLGNDAKSVDKNETKLSKEKLSCDPSNDRPNDCKTSIESLKMTGDSQSNLIDNLVDTTTPLNETTSQKKKSSSNGNFAMTRSSIRKSNVSEYSLGRQSQTSSAAKDILDVLRTIEDRLKQLTNKVDTIEENQKKMMKRMWEKEIKETESFFQKESPISRNTTTTTTNPFGKSYGKSFDTLSLSLNSAPHNNRHSNRNKSSRSSFRCLTRTERKTGLIDTSLSLDSPEKLSLSPFSSGIFLLLLSSNYGFHRA